MATVTVYEERDDAHTSRRKDKKDKKHKKDKKSSLKSEIEKTVPAGLEMDFDEPSEADLDKWQMEPFDGASDTGSTLSLSLDEAERERLLISEEESSVSTVEDAPTTKGTSYYLAHQRYIESKALTPLEEVCDARTSPLSEIVIKNLQKLGMSTLFPVQAEVIPFILRSAMWGGDVCVCAPTGSGKTLAYVIPIVQKLCTRSLRRLRALVLVPTHDLVVQVSNVFMTTVEGTDLVVEALYGNKGFESEQMRLVPSRQRAATSPLAGGSSLVDIVVSTPGRLIDHLQETPGFTLQHLQFLVLDEADRLLMHSFQDWLPKVLEAIHQHHEGHMNRPDNARNDVSFSTAFSTASNVLEAQHTQIDPVTNRSSFLNVAVMERQYTHLQKLLFSATLTQNPEKINSLRLVNPQYFTATTSGKSFLYTIPEKLEQNLTVCTEQHKPLLLLYILTQFKDAQTLCFVSSIETAHRLTLLLKFLHAEQFLNNHPIYEYSSSLSQQERNQIILKFKAGAPGVIICSDVMARGLDIQNVRAVVNYDLPFHVKTYVHRVGRTGRAGRAGTSWSIALKDEVRKFKNSLSKAENATQNYIPLPYEDIKQHFGRYKEALRQLAIEMEREKGAAATQQSLLHASFSLPLDSPNIGDKKSISKSLLSQVARAWFPDDAQALSSGNQEIAPPSTSSAPSSTVNTPQKPRKIIEPVSSKPAAKETKEDDSKTKAKRRRRNKKSELDSLSFSSSDSSSSDSESSEPVKVAKVNAMVVDPLKVVSKPSESSGRSKNRKKRKRGELESLSLSSSSSSSSDEEVSSSKKEKRRSRSKKSKDKSKKAKK